MKVNENIIKTFSKHLKTNNKKNFKEISSIKKSEYKFISIANIKLKLQILIL